MKFIAVVVILVMSFLLLLPFGCANKQNVFKDPHFYYDEENYTLLRVNPETRDEDIKRYLERPEQKMFKSFAHKPKPDTSIEFDIPPRVKKTVIPKYPAELGKEGYSGKVILKMLVNEQGIVIMAKPFSGVQKLDRIGIQLMKAALEAAIQTEFYPARQKGNPVKIWVSYPIQFELLRY
jgi:TonB family protein